MPQGNIKVTGIQFSNSHLLPEIIRMLDEGHTVTLRLKGYSMRPFLEDGRDKALLSKPSKIKVGDPVLAEMTPGQFVLHRIIKIQNDEVTLRGDGNLNTEKCRLVDIKGAVIGFYRKGKEELDLTNGMKWRAYSFLWTNLYPIRRYLLYIYRHLWIKLFPIKTI